MMRPTLLIACCAVVVSGQDVQLAIMQRMSDLRTAEADCSTVWANGTVGPTCWLTGVWQAIAATALVAVDDFNSRNGRYVPAFANLPNGCNKRLVPTVYDTGSTPKGAVNDLFQMLSDGAPDAIVGPARSVVSMPTAIIAGVGYNIPQISYWSTSKKLSDKDDYPFFMRTIPSDHAVANAVCNFWSEEMGYTRAAIIHASDPYAQAYEESLVSQCRQNWRVEIDSFSFIENGRAGNQESIVRAVTALKDLNLPATVVMLVATDPGDVRDILFEASNRGLTGVGSMWVHADHEMPTDGPLSPPVEGNIRILAVGGDNPRYTQYVSTDFAAIDHVRVNAALPAPFRVDSNFFTTFDAVNSPLIRDVATYEYDAVAAIGLLACEIAPTGPLPSDFGRLVWASKNSLSFRGLSGDSPGVRFLPNGDRDPGSASYNLYNFNIDGESGVGNETLRAQFHGQSWNWTGGNREASGLRFGGGTTIAPADPGYIPAPPSHPPAPPLPDTILPDEAVVGLIVGVLLLILIVVGCWYCWHLERKRLKDYLAYVQRETGSLQEVMESHLISPSMQLQQLIRSLRDKEKSASGRAALDSALLSLEQLAASTTTLHDINVAKLLEVTSRHKGNKLHLASSEDGSEDDATMRAWLDQSFGGGSHTVVGTPVDSSDSLGEGSIMLQWGDDAAEKEDGLGPEASEKAEPGSGVVLGGAAKVASLSHKDKDVWQRLDTAAASLFTGGDGVDWALDVPSLDTLTGGHCMRALFPLLLKRHGLMNELKIHEGRLHRFLAEAERRYGANPYHNRMHAADVANTMSCCMRSFGLDEALSPVQRLAALFAALMHDFMHPGSSNAYEIKVLSAHALRYSDDSVLEHHHLEATFSLLHQPGFNFLSRALRREEYRDFRRAVIAMVLATDLKKHFEYISRLRSVQFLSDFTSSLGGTRAGAGLLVRSDGGSETALDEEKISFALQACLKFSDLGHSCKVWEQHERWTEWVTEEFYLLGDKEKAMSGPEYVSPLCDRKKDKNVPKSQVGFFNFICLPFYNAVAHALPLSKAVGAERCQANFEEWERKLAESGSFKQEKQAPSEAPAAVVKADSGEVAVRVISR